MKKINTVVSFERLSFPEVSDLDMAFGGYPKDWFNETLKKAKEEGFTGYSNNEWEKRFSSLFYSGGCFNLNRKLDNKYLNDGCRIFKAIAGSFDLKHEHKTAVCGFIIKSIEAK